MEELSESFRELELSLAGSVTWSSAGDSVCLYSDHMLKLEGVPPGIVRCLSLLERGAAYGALALESGDSEQLDQVLRTLIRLRFVIRMPSDEWRGTRAERQVSYFSAHSIDGCRAQYRLRASHVMVLGVGGIGSVLLQHLVAAGIRHYTLIDSDEVRIQDLNRQMLFRPEQIGRPKVAAAANYILAHDPEATVVTWPGFIDSVEALLEVPVSGPLDFLAVAADHPVGTVQALAAGFCLERSVAFLSGGCGLNAAAWGPLVTPDQCRAYLDYLRAPDQVSRGLTDGCPPARPMQASFGPTNTIAAGFMARDLLHYLTGLPVASLGKLMSVDFRSMTVRATPVPPMSSA